VPDEQPTVRTDSHESSTPEQPSGVERPPSEPQVALQHPPPLPEPVTTDTIAAPDGSPGIGNGTGAGARGAAGANLGDVRAGVDNSPAATPEIGVTTGVAKGDVTEVGRGGARAGVSAGPAKGAAASRSGGSAAGAAGTAATASATISGDAGAVTVKTRLASASIASVGKDLLGRTLSTVVFSDKTAVGQLTPTQTAAWLYRFGNTRAAKELLCNQREFYIQFKQTDSPCQRHSEWEPKGTAQASNRSAPTTFRPDRFPNKADCLTAAYSSGVPLAACSSR